MILRILKKLLGIKTKELFDTYKLPNGSVLYLPKGENPNKVTTGIHIKLEENK